MTFRTLPAALLPLAAWCIIACTDPTGSAPAPAAVMLGEWTYARAPSAAGPPPTLNAGLSVAIAVDSASGMRFWGHVARWFAGDVGLPVTRFGPVSGSIDSTSGVVLRIQGTQIAALRIEGEVAGDVLTVHASWAGVEPGPFPSGCRFQRLH